VRVRAYEDGIALVITCIEEDGVRGLKKLCLGIS
jgi:hypothetical protein